VANNRAAVHQSVDRAIIGGAIGLCATVLVPWLLGRFVLRDTFLLPTRTTASSEIRNVLRSSVGSYFLSDYLSGVCAVAAIAAILGLVRPWRGRPVAIALSLAMLAGSWFAHAEALQHWNSQEDVVNARMPVVTAVQTLTNGSVYLMTSLTTQPSDASAFHGLFMVFSNGQFCVPGTSATDTSPAARFDLDRFKPNGNNCESYSTDLAAGQVTTAGTVFLSNLHESNGLIVGDEVAAKPAPQIGLFLYTQAQYASLPIS